VEFSLSPLLTDYPRLFPPAAYTQRDHPARAGPLGRVIT
jgi:hypothetical protein